MASSTNNQLYEIFRDDKKNGYNIHVKFLLKNDITFTVNLKAQLNYFIAH